MDSKIKKASITTALVAVFAIVVNVLVLLGSLGVTATAPASKAIDFVKTITSGGISMLTRDPINLARYLFSVALTLVVIVHVLGLLLGAIKLLGTKGDDQGKTLDLAKKCVKKSSITFLIVFSFLLNTLGALAILAASSSGSGNPITRIINHVFSSGFISLVVVSVVMFVLRTIVKKQLRKCKKELAD